MKDNKVFHVRYACNRNAASGEMYAEDKIDAVDKIKEWHAKHHGECHVTVRFL